MEAGSGMLGAQALRRSLPRLRLAGVIVGSAAAGVVGAAAVLLLVVLLLLLMNAAPAHARGLGAGAPIPFSLFPADNPWNTPVDALPVDTNSADYLASIGLTTGLHADFGTVWDGAPNGMPYVCVAGTQAKVPVVFTAYGDESDPGPYPIPLDAPVEGGPKSDGDRHVLALDVDNLRLYELYDAHPKADHWEAGCGAVFDLTTNALRPDGWTSADAAGLPILPGLARYDEAVTEGHIDHALRFTVSQTQRAYIYPATHFASSSTDPDLPPMGLRVRLKASYDISGFPAEDQAILQAMKTYGMIVADNGSDWYVSGAPDSRWSDDDLHLLSQVKGSDFEVVDTSSLAPGAVAVTAGADATLTEGQTLTRAGSFRDGASTAWTATVDWGEGAAAEPLTLAPDQTFLLSHPCLVAGVHAVTVTVHGNGGGAAGTMGSGRFTVKVRNLAPRVHAGPAATVRRGSAWRRRVTFGDPGAERFRARVAWGDGSGYSHVRLGSRRAFTIHHTWRRAGRFTVSVRVSDGHAGRGVDRFRVTVR
jgi:hypothetical protein